MTVSDIKNFVNLALFPLGRKHLLLLFIGRLRVEWGGGPTV